MCARYRGPLWAGGWRRAWVGPRDGAPDHGRPFRDISRANEVPFGGASPGANQIIIGASPPRCIPALGYHPKWRSVSEPCRSAHHAADGSTRTAARWPYRRWRCSSNSSSSRAAAAGLRGGRGGRDAAAPQHWRGDLRWTHLPAPHAGEPARGRSAGTVGCGVRSGSGGSGAARPAPKLQVARCLLSLAKRSLTSGDRAASCLALGLPTAAAQTPPFGAAASPRWVVGGWAWVACVHVGVTEGEGGRCGSLPLLMDPLSTPASRRWRGAGEAARPRGCCRCAAAWSAARATMRSGVLLLCVMADVRQVPLGH